MMRRYLTVNHMQALLTIAVLGAAGCGQLQEPRNDQKQPAQENSLATTSTESQQKSSVLRQARVYRVPSATGMRQNSFVARVDAAQSIDLAFEVAGTLVELPVREGQTIPRGKLIAKLDQTRFRLAVEEAEVDLKLKRTDHRRKASLLDRNGISASVVDNALASAELAAVRLKQARETLAETRLTAPFDAYLAQRLVDNHTNIQAAVPVARLFDLRTLHLRANVPDALLATLSQEDVASLTATFSFAPERSFPIRYLEHRGEASSVAQTYEVTFELDPPPGLNLLPGMTASVQLERHQPNDAALAFDIPASALVTNASNTLGVWVLNELTDNIRWQPVTATPVTGGKMRITQGLSGNELIVTTGTALLHREMRIKPMASVAR